MQETKIRQIDNSFISTLLRFSHPSQSVGSWLWNTNSELLLILLINQVWCKWIKAYPALMSLIYLNSQRSTTNMQVMSLKCRATGTCPHAKQVEQFNTNKKETSNEKEWRQWPRNQASMVASAGVAVLDFARPQYCRNWSLKRQYRCKVVVHL